MSAPDKRCETLADLPLLPRDEEGPVFEAPWQAQAFAVVVELIDSGQVSRTEWAECLGAQFKAAEDRGEYDTGKRYYDHWLAALEALVINKQLAGWQELSDEKAEIKAHDHHRREDQLGHEH